MAIRIRHKLGGEKRGILLTLLIIVLVVVMLGELMSYVVLNTNYQSLTSSSASILGLSSVKSNTQEGLHAFLKSSLGNAHYALVVYEGTPTMRNGLFINSTQQAFSSLIQTGKIYSMNMQNYMGPTLAAFLSALSKQATYQNAQVSIGNLTLTIFQGSPFSINASLTGLAVINSQTGTFYTPLNVTAGINISYMQDLAALEGASNALIKEGNIPKALLIGNVFAQSGSISPFMFAYGNALVISGSVPTCNSIPVGFRNANYILVTANAMSINQIVCGMGGLVTTIPNAMLPLMPYLVYSSAAVINTITTNQPILLNGAGLALMNLTPLRNAISNNTYFAASYAPSYFDRIQNNFLDSSPNGMASFGVLNMKVASLNGVSSYISVGNIAGTSGSWTTTFWASVNTLVPTVQYPIGFGSGTSSSAGICMASSAASEDWCVYDGSSTIYGSAISPNVWYFIAVTKSGSTYTLYTNGNPVGSGSMANLPISNLNIGRRSDGLWYTSGSIADVQVYNTLLSSSAIQQLYQEGVYYSIPLSNTGLAGWWPLISNANDYSGRGASANTVASVIYANATGYNGDSLSLNEFQTFRTYAAGFNALASSYIEQQSGYGFMSSNAVQPFSVSVWVNPNAPSGVIIDELAQFTPNSGGHDTMLELVSGKAYMRLSGLACVSLGSIPTNVWSNIVITYNGNVNNGYVNGVLKGTASGTRSVTPGASMYYPLGVIDSTNCGSGAYYGGEMANYQFYNTSISANTIQALYQEGLNGGPIGNAGLVNWWPLSGNANDYSGNGNPATPTAVMFSGLPSDPTADLVQGVLNCANMNQCSNLNLQHLYLNPLPLEYAGMGFMNETTSLGLMNAGIMDVASFNGPGSYIQTGSGYAAPSALTMSIWFYSNGAVGSNQFPLDSDSEALWRIGFNSANQILFDPGSHSDVTLSNTIAFKTWENIIVTAQNSGGSASYNAFLNGVNVGSGSVANNIVAVTDLVFGAKYFNFRGLIADVQVYNTVLTSSQAQQLYLNNSVIGLSPIAYWPLSTGLNGVMNQTADIAGGNTSYLYGFTSGGICTNANAINGMCNVQYTPP